MASVASDLQSVGKSVAKPDARAKATGAAIYAGDIRVAGVLEAKILHSPHAHARIVSIDTSAAEALPGVYAVVIPSDVAKATRPQRFPAMAGDKTVFIGETIAAVAAIDEETADLALQLIHVEYAPLTAVFDPERSFDPDLPVIRPDEKDQAAVGPGNIRGQGTYEVGDVDGAFANPGIITHEDTYRTSRQSPGYTEPHAAIAQADVHGKITIWASNKAPFRTRIQVANALGSSLSQVRISAPLIGGDFGGKGGGLIEPVLALLARRARRPVRLVLSRAEEFTSMFCRPPFTMRLKMGARSDGTIVALEGEQVLDMGAIDDFDPGQVAGALGLLGPYKIPNVRIKTTAVRTNSSPAGHVRAPSGPQQAFALESQLDSMARKLKMDPIDLRLKNVVQNGDVVPSGHGILRNSGLDECVRGARDWISHQTTERGPHRGIGFALGAMALGPKPAAPDSAATVRIDVDGSVVVLTGASDQGAGQWSLVAQIVGEVLGVPLDRVSVIASDTEVTPYERFIGGSTGTYRFGNSVRQAAEDARARLMRLAEPVLQVDHEEVALGGGDAYVRSDPSRRVAIAQLAQAAMTSPGGEISGDSGRAREREIEEYAAEQRETVDAPSFCCHVAEVEVDPETGIVRVLRYYAVQDVGKAINPMACTGQIQGGVVFGLGFALSEEIIGVDGNNVNANLWEYLLPMAPEIPDITVDLVEVPSKFGPFGAKGIGETPTIPVAAAIANAIEAAIGVRVTASPFTPERVLAAIRSQRPDL